MSGACLTLMWGCTNKMFSVIIWSETYANIHQTKEQLMLCLHQKYSVSSMRLTVVTLPVARLEAFCLQMVQRETYRNTTVQN